MRNSRRTFLKQGVAAAVAGSMAARRRPSTLRPDQRDVSFAPGLPGRNYRPVVTPDGATLPFTIRDGVKIFHLIAMEVDQEFAPGLEARCFGFNGRVHGPTLEAVEGDHVRIYVTNRLPAPTTVHWHGMLLPNGMDGVGGLTQRTIEPGETFKYEFTLRQYGTLMYHSHHDEMTQMALGLMGMFVIHPRNPEEPPPDRDYVYLLSEWKIDPGARRPDPNEMTDFNVLTFNARVFPGTQPIVAVLGERVRIRFGNLSAMSHHPIHLHGYHFDVTETDAGPIPKEGRWPETTVVVPVGATRTIEFMADAPGDWALHCHMTHHIMNQMGHGIPNLVGVDLGAFEARLLRAVPAYQAMAEGGMGDDEDEPIPENSLPMMGGAGPLGYITMGGMFTMLKVRDSIEGDEDPGWYEAPPGTRAEAASSAELEADGIEVDEVRR